MRRALPAGLALGIYGLLLLPGSAASQAHPEEVKPVHWVVSGVKGVAGKKTFWAAGPSVGICVGEPEPWLEPRVRERRGRSIVTVTMHSPAIPETTGPIYCADVVLKLAAKVRLKRPLCDVTLYDGSTSPPHRRSLHHLDPYCESSARP